MFKTGKLPAVRDHRDLRLASYLTPSFPTPPATFGHQNLVKQWGMLGNDQYGDCVFAGAAHETMLWNATSGRNVNFDDTCVLKDYGNVTGFNTNDPSTDRGTNVRDALSFRIKTGSLDHLGHRHKIAGYVALNPGDVNHLRIAMFLFNAVGIGFEFPLSAQDQFAEGKPWEVVPGAKIDGGHYVPLIAQTSPDHIECVTWSRLEPMSIKFFLKYCDEAYAILSHDMIKRSRAMNIDGFKWADLLDDLHQIGAA